MKKYFSKTAFTLLELLVALILVSVVVLGVFSINYVLSNNNQDYGQRFLVRSETQTTLNHILNDAALAVGSGTNVGTPSDPDLGILIGQNGVTPVNSFCIHQRQQSLVSSSNSLGDIWVCYTLNLNQISYCNVPYNLTPSDNDVYRGANASCSGSSTFLGTAYSISNNNGYNNSPPSFINTGSQMLFSITIQNCLNNSLTSCNSSGASTDPVNNPEVQVTGSTFPLQEGSVQN